MIDGHTVQGKSMDMLGSVLLDPVTSNVSAFRTLLDPDVHVNGCPIHTAFGSPVVLFPSGKVASLLAQSHSFVETEEVCLPDGQILSSNETSETLEFWESGWPKAIYPKSPGFVTSVGGCETRFENGELEFSATGKPSRFFRFLETCVGGKPIALWGPRYINMPSLASIEGIAFDASGNVTRGLAQAGYNTFEMAGGRKVRLSGDLYFHPSGALRRGDLIEVLGDGKLLKTDGSLVSLYASEEGKILTFDESGRLIH